MPRYMYKGSVLEYGRVISRDWEAETFAISEAKARGNFAYQYKMAHNKKTHFAIELPGKITIIDD